KSFESFELAPRALELLLGDNGSGKTTLLDALSRIRRLSVVGKAVHEAFPPHTRTRWSDTSVQRFQLDVQLEKNNFAYSLEIDNEQNTRILSERVDADGKSLYSASQAQTRFFDETGNTKGLLAFSGGESWLGRGVVTWGSRRLKLFFNWLARLCCV